MARLRYNNALGTLAAPMGTSDTTISFITAPPFATIVAPDYIPIVIDPPSDPSPNTAFEIVYLTAFSAGASTGTILRGQEGTTAASHGGGAVWVCGPTGLDQAGVTQMLASWQGPLPTAIGSTAVWRVPYVSGAAITFNLLRAYARVETAGPSPTSVVIEKSPSGLFVATAVTMVTIAASANEGQITSGLGSVSSGQLLRATWSALGASNTSYTIELEGAAQ